MKLRIAYVPLTDAATLVAARELGFFEKHALDVTLVREQSWASVRDNLVAGRVDAAQMLASLPLALAAGASHSRVPLVVGLVLSLNGNAITVSNDLFQALDDTGLLRPDQPASAGQALKAVVDARRALGKPRLCFASVFRSSTHYFLLRHWMAAAGIDTERDIRFVVIPPPRMVESLQSGLIDGCCVGEPWNHDAVSEFAGHILLAGLDVRQHAAEKVLAVREDWLDGRDVTYQRLCTALIETAAYCDEPAHRPELARLLARRDALGVHESVIAPSLLGQVCDSDHVVRRMMPDFHVFYRDGAGVPWPAQAEWLLEQMQRWGQLPHDAPVVDVARTVYRSDIYRAAAQALGDTFSAAHGDPGVTAARPRDGDAVLTVSRSVEPG